VRLTDTGAVHHRIQLAESIDRSLCRALAQVGVGDVARHADGLAPIRDDARGLRLGLGRVQIGDDDPRAPLGKPRPNLGANATGPAEDQDDFVWHKWKIRA
jgi:hypothetical protein